MIANFVLLLAVLAVAFAQTEFPEPPPTFQAAEFTKWDEDFTVAKSRRSTIDVRFTAADGSPDAIQMKRLDLVGDAKERGFAHGALLADDIVDFTGKKLDDYIASMVTDFDVSELPEFVQKIIKGAEKLGHGKVVPWAFREAMQAVWNKEENNVSQALKDEINGIAEGMCFALGEHCNQDKMVKQLRAVNMLPELIRMSCTAFGAWGKARSQDAKGSLLQLRALDFGSGPFANYTVIQTHRGDPNNADNAFVNVAFPGFVGAITGVSQNGIGISEKVWMTSGTKKDLLPGNYQGEPDTFVLRNILEFSKTKEEATQYMQNAKRTWAMWVGVGDYASQELNLVGYKEASAIAYNDTSMPAMTTQPFISEIAYVDKYPQPSASNGDGSLPKALMAFADGGISQHTTKQIVQYHSTGDLHAATYDFGAKQMHLTIGKINAQGNYCPEEECETDNKVWMAYNRPWTQFNLEDLWAGN